MNFKTAMTIAVAILLCGLSTSQTAPQGGAASRIKSEILAQGAASWDGTAYAKYPSGQPQLTVRRIVIPPHTALDWHSHPMPNAAYLVSGEITVEKKEGGSRHFTAGQVVLETVSEVHRGVTGDKAAVLIVFYAGIPGMPLSQ